MEMCRLHHVIESAEKVLSEGCATEADDGSYDVVKGGESGNALSKGSKGQERRWRL